MYIDIPVLKRCCFCLPLRPGLLAWSYIKLVFNILMLINLAHLLSMCIPVIEKTKVPVVILSVMTFFTILDTVVGIFFIISAHMKNYKLMNIYYKYSLVMLILLILAVFSFLIFICVRIENLTRKYGITYLADMIVIYIEAALSACFLAIFYIYMILLVRSEVLKLESNIRCKFVNTRTCASDVDNKDEVERAFYNRLSSDPEPIYSQCTVVVGE